MSRDQDNRSNQLNPNNSAYWSSRGYGSDPRGREFDDDGDDPNHPYNLNPRRPGIGFSGLPEAPAPAEIAFLNEKQKRAEQFRTEFLEVAEKVIKPEMDKFVSRLRKLRIKAEARICGVTPGSSGWLEIEFKFSSKPRSSFLPDQLVSFVCEERWLVVEIKAGCLFGHSNIKTHTMKLEDITPTCVSQMLDTAVKNATGRQIYAPQTKKRY
jgi:hypothetical protein